MSLQVIVPSLGESISEATVLKWFKNVGEAVEVDEPLVELETDKVNVEVPSPTSGTLSTIEAKEGDVVKVGGLLGTLKEGKVSSDQKEDTKLKDQKEESYSEPKKSKKNKLPSIFPQPVWSSGGFAGKSSGKDVTNPVAHNNLSQSLVVSKNITML